jgi:hypothetical protein
MKTQTKKEITDLLFIGIISIMLAYAVGRLAIDKAFNDVPPVNVVIDYFIVLGAIIVSLPLGIIWAIVHFSLSRRLEREKDEDLTKNEI